MSYFYSVFLSKFFLILSAIWFNCNSESFGQAKFLEGYIINSSKDTINGYIEYQDWDINPIYINFRTSQEVSVKEKLGTDQVQEFYRSSLDIRYKKKKIGLYDIQLDIPYSRLPNQPKVDSLVKFLLEVTSGPKATLYSYSISTNQTHFYLEKDGELSDLINYPYYRSIDNKQYLAVWDEYKEQLKALFADAAFAQNNSPKYNVKSLRQYVDKYNQLDVADEKPSGYAVNDRFSLDVGAIVGLDGWNTHFANIRNKPIFGIGLRVNLPYKFNNRYLRFAYQQIPGIPANEIFGPYFLPTKLMISTLEIGFGSYIGSGKLRPYVGMDANFPLNTRRSIGISPHFGIGFMRNLNLEIGQFANAYAIFDNGKFLKIPRITLGYFLNVSSFFQKK